MSSYTREECETLANMVKAQGCPKEWTPEYVRSLLSYAANRAMSDEYVQDICDRHKDALAHAEPLAEACEKLMTWLTQCDDYAEQSDAWKFAKKTLAAWEGAQK